MKFFSIAVALFGMSLGGAFGQDSAPAYPADGANYMLYPTAKPPLVPMPQMLKWGAKSLKLDSVRIEMPKGVSYPEQLRFIRAELTSFLAEHRVKVNDGAGFVIKFKRGEVKAKTDKPKLKDEAYSLTVSPKGVLITAKDTTGFFYGMKTLEQLILRRGGKTTVAACQIIDWPDFEVRGFMNDVGRNYMPLELIKKEIDSMAQMKLNVYHFHFTEGPGWRLESKIYPQLTEEKNLERIKKFYTQEEFKELVEYCRIRNILLIPEMDMPGHSAAFRRALGVKMSDEKATVALEALIKEMCDLVPADKMPIIHIGTDEVRGNEEKVNKETLNRYFAAVVKAGRTPMRYQPGQRPDDKYNPILHLWSGRQNRHAWPIAGSKYIDSLETYLNHIDPFEVPMTMYFRRACPFENADGLGMLLCSWPDLEITDPRNQVLQTPVYSGIAFVSEPLWNNPHEPVKGDPNKDPYMKYFSNLPVQGDPLLKGFAEYENRILAIRDRFFINKEFNYVRQSNIPWKLLGPIPNGGKTEQDFIPVADIGSGAVKNSYTVNGKEYSWSNESYTGGTIIFKHYCDFPTIFNGDKMGAYPHKNHTYYAQTWIYSPKEQTVPFWISGHTWATSDWRNGPASVPGKWFHANPRFFINGKEVMPPEWKKPRNGGVLVDENYHFRAPSMVPLKKGWNQVIIKSPSNNGARRWMFTCAPVQVDEKNFGCNVKEFPGLKFSDKPKRIDEN